MSNQTDVQHKSRDTSDTRDVRIKRYLICKRPLFGVYIMSSFIIAYLVMIILLFFFFEQNFSVELKFFHLLLFHAYRISSHAALDSNNANE